MKKLILAVIVLSIGYVTIAKAEEKTVTPQEFADAVASVPAKVGNHISNEIEKTKEFQKKNWAEIKVQWSNLISKFSNK